MRSSPLFDSAPTNDELKDRLRKAEEFLRKCEKLAIAGRYAVAVMHEVNNALAGVNNLVYLAHKEPHNSENIRQYMPVAATELKRLGEITRKTLSFHRMEPQATECDLVKIVETALLMHSHQFSARSITVQTEFDPPVMAVVFEGEILQVFSNFILNALDAPPQKNPQLRFRVKILKDRAHIVIADNQSNRSQHCSRCPEPSCRSYLQAEPRGTAPLDLRIIAKKMLRGSLYPVQAQIVKPRSEGCNALLDRSSGGQLSLYQRLRPQLSRCYEKI